MVGSGEKLTPRVKEHQLWSKHLLFEIMILAICPIPFYDMYIYTDAKRQEVIYLLSEFCPALMWLRIYFVIRTIFNYSIFTDAYSKKLC